MRLIDGKALADEILGEIYERGQASGLWEQQLEIGALTYRDIEFANGYDKALDGVYRKISNTPTVKAIPIEWLKQYFRKCVSFNDLVFIDNEDSRYDIVIDKYQIFEDWRKENG